jgi:Holliday junction resolvasome RuvABC endonuclease subunit
MSAQPIAIDCVYRILAIDPGTNALGVAVLDVDIDKAIVTVQHATTIDISKLSQNYPQLIMIHGERVSKLHAVEMALFKMFRAWKPDEIVSEAPYLGRFPQAFSALVECLSSIRRAVMEYNRALPLPTIDPASVKKAVGVSGKSGDKDAITVAIQRQPDLLMNVNVNDLDEHARDAIAVGYAFYKTRTQGSHV